MHFTDYCVASFQKYYREVVGLYLCCRSTG